VREHVLESGGEPFETGIRHLTHGALQGTDSAARSGAE
jgi:hypothetical protein